MDKSNNPFNPNTTVPPLLFAGRAQQIAKILVKLERVKQGQSASFILHGERGIGKTALAKLVGFISQKKDKKLHNLNFITSYYAVDKKRSLQSVLEVSLNILTDDLPTDTLKKLSAKLGGVFSNGKFSFGAFGLNLSLDTDREIEKSMYFKDQLISSLSNLIKETVLDGHKFDGILIIIDEIQNIEDLEEAAQVFKGIINTLDFRDRGYISFLLLGYSHGVEAFFKGDPSARRSFDSTRLEVMPSPEAQEVLTKGFVEIQLPYDKELLGEKINIAGGYPHALQVLGQNLVNVDTDNFIDAGDWELAIKRSAEELRDKDFFDCYSFASQQTTRDTIMNIVALANGGLLITKKTLSDVLGRNSYKHVSRLIQQGALRERSIDNQLEPRSKLLSTAISFYLTSHLREELLKTQAHLQQIKRLIQQ